MTKKCPKQSAFIFNCTPKTSIVLMMTGAVACAAGCNKSAAVEPTPPRGGYNMHQVTYNTGTAICLASEPRVASATLVEIPEIDLEKPEIGVLTIVLPDQVGAKQTLCVDGVIHVEEPVKAAALISVECYFITRRTVTNPETKQAERRDTRESAVLKHGVTGGGTNGRLNYRVQFKGPQRRGKYVFEIRCLHQPTSLVARVLAKGELVVK